MSQPEQLPSRVGRFVGLAVTNMTKLAGVALALNEGFGHVSPRPVLVGVSALMIAGAQGIERAIDRFLGAGQ